MGNEKLLLQEIQQEAENAKRIIKKEVEVSVEELSKISLSDFVLTSPIRPIEKSIEECVLEFERRIETVETNLAKELDVLIHQMKFFQYDIVKTAANRMMYGFIYDDGPWLNHPIIETNDIQAKVQSKLLCTPWMLLIPNMAVNQIKKTSEEVFQAEIKSKRDIIINFSTGKITKQIDRILDYIKSEIS